MKKLLLILTALALIAGGIYLLNDPGRSDVNYIEEIRAEVADDDREKENARIEAEKKRMRNDWESYISIKSASFAKKKIAGITDLTVSIENRTPYTIDEARATVNYLNLVGDIVNTREVTFTNVAPNGSKRIKVPDSNRGVDVKVITDWVQSKELNLCTAEGNWRANATADDPYKCE